MTIETAPVAATDTAAFRPSVTRSKWAMVLVGISSWALVLSGVSVAQGIALIDHPASASALEITEWEAFSSAANGLYIITLIAAAIASLAWLSRVIANMPSLGGGRPAVSPRGAIVWWFVPFANLVKPYLIVSDLWRRLASTKVEHGSGLVLVWWLAWLGGSLAGWFVGRLEPTTIADLRGLLIVTMVTIAAQAVAGILLISIIWEVERRVRVRRAVGSGDGPDPGGRRVAFCPFCGSVSVQDAPFCGSCGANLELRPRGVGEAADGGSQRR